MLHFTEERLRSVIERTLETHGFPQGLSQRVSRRVVEAVRVRGQRDEPAGSPGRALAELVVAKVEDLERQVAEHEETLQFVLGELDGLEERLEEPEKDRLDIVEYLDVDLESAKRDLFLGVPVADLTRDELIVALHDTSKRYMRLFIGEGGEE